MLVAGVGASLSLGFDFEEQNMIDDSLGEKRKHFLYHSSLDRQKLRQTPQVFPDFLSPALWD